MDSTNHIFPRYSGWNLKGSEIDSIAVQVSVWLGGGGREGGYDLLCICTAYSMRDHLYRKSYDTENKLKLTNCKYHHKMKM